MTQPFKTARDVAEHMLELTGEALMSGNFDSFAACFVLPQELQTFVGKRILENEDDLRDVFFAILNHYANTGVTEMARHCIEAEFKDATTVEAVHETRLLSGNLITQAAFPVFSTIVFDGTRWRVAGTSYAIEDRPEHNAALLGIKAGRSKPGCTQPQTEKPSADTAAEGDH